MFRRSLGPFRSGARAMNISTASSLGAGDHSVGPVRVGDVVAEKYLVERTLGVGGMGVVVQARDQVLDRQVAIKFLLPKLAGSETAVQRFVREARAATRITSEHVVRLLEIEKLPSGTPFFVMEYLEGCDLRTLLRERGALPASQAVDYALQALQAVAEGHVRGIVHRDIKPGNLFLSRRADGTPLIKVLDFGIAKTAESDAAESTSLTSSDDVRLGSPAYMPPEQLQNPRDVDLRSDIWSFGATLYELLCGRPPFEGPGYLELATHVLNRPPTPFAQHQLPEPLPEGLEKVVLKCLEKERGFRYANAAELATALARYGSADARMSLTRVSGMFASSSSFPALTRAVATDPDACDPTLDVSSGSGGRASKRPEVTQTADADNRSTSNIQGQIQARSTKSWLTIAAVAAVGIIGFVASRGAVVAVSPTVGATSPPAVAAAPSVLAVAPSAVAASSPTAFTPTSTAPAALSPVASGAAPASAPVAVSELVKVARPSVDATPRKFSSRTGGPKLLSSVTEAPSGAIAAIATPPALSVPSLAATAPGSSVAAEPRLGRSEEIERLIERRR
jgi:eukaryotic-like serine/threonine-protein kinase